MTVELERRRRVGKLRSRHDQLVAEINRVTIARAPVRFEVDGSGRTWRIVSLPAQVVAPDQD